MFIKRDFLEEVVVSPNKVFVALAKSLQKEVKK